MFYVTNTVPLKHKQNPGLKFHFQHILQVVISDRASLHGSQANTVLTGFVLQADAYSTHRLSRGGLLPQAQTVM